MIVDMASSANSLNSSISSEAAAERRPQAGPLPRKRGEIGYQENVDGQSEEDNRDNSITPLPPRHPADREPEPAPTPEANDAANAAPPDSALPPPFSSASSDTDTASLQKPQRHGTFWSWLNPRSALKRKRIGGVALGTVLRLTFQIAVLAGTIALWIVVSRVLTVSHGNNASATGSQNQPPPPNPEFLSGSSAIFIHVSFGVVTLVQLLFLERCIFFVRAQRYAHNHPGASLPRHRTRNGPSTGPGSLVISMAPWNRPPLPTYAAALAESGVGTGDVEDNIIAIPPPPAYGHTRNSTLLLTGYLRNSLRAAIPHESSSSRPASQASRLSRPVSYCSHDEEWEERRDAQRALRLAETLERLQAPVQPSITAARTG